jgi:hypothetical protein
LKQEAMQIPSNSTSSAAVVPEHQEAGARTGRIPRLSPEARRYAVKELARRAGVTREFFEKWKIEVSAERTRIVFGTGQDKVIHFLHAKETDIPFHAGEQFPIAKADWMRPKANGAFTKRLILPFCYPDREDGEPLYRIDGNGSVVCCADLLASIVLTLCRMEEIGSSVRDEHSRFLASGSVAFQQNFLERPILDEHGLAFEQVLATLLPSWNPLPRRLRVKLSHDIDQVGMPFQLNASVGHALKRRSVSATARDFAALFSGLEPVELSLVRSLARISKSRGLHSAFYWKASETSPWDTGYDPMDWKVQSVIRFLKENGFEMGVHPAYKTLGDRLELSREVDRLKTALGVRTAGGRQHYLRWAPETWRDWETCGLAYDSSVGFAEHFGFRAGTAFPYRPWSLRENRELELIEIPLVLMDVTPVRYMKLELREGLERIRLLVERTAEVGGVFCMLWHNTSILEPDFRGWYEEILEMLAGAKGYEVPERGELVW